MTCRNLLKLLGIGLSHGGVTLRTFANAQKPSIDAWMTDFRLQPVPVYEACRNHPDLSQTEVKRIIGVVLRASNVGIGHLTDKSTRDIITARDVAVACDIVIALVNRHIYNRLDTQIISELSLPKSGFPFEFGSKHGHIHRIADNQISS
jgi:hypothetical protein